MPEAPDLEVIKDFLNSKIRGSRIDKADVLKPTVLRSLAGDFCVDIKNRTFDVVRRRGKFLLIELSEDRHLVINPMLTGVLQLCQAQEQTQKRTCLTLSLERGQELRYLDDRQMGMVYYVSGDQMSQVPRLHEQGPDVLDGLSLEEFQARLKRFHGEIKGILTRGSLMSGIGNAYSDEILFAAGLSPFRKSRTLSSDEIERLHKQSRVVVEEAMAVLRRRVGDDIHVKIRDFLKVHRKGGQPCPSCGGNISQITSNQRITSYCRHCQPGMLIKN